MELNAHLGGRPGIDCGGFCEFCFYRNVDLNILKSLALGCTYCPPNQIGCEHCHKPITRIENNFKPLNKILEEIGKNLAMLEMFDMLNYQDFRMNITGGADLFYYPNLNKIVSILRKTGMSIHLGYTSGKGIKDEMMAERFIVNGVDEISFSVFSTDPELRKKWMRDKTPEVSLNALKQFCRDIEVNASVVVIPGVNDEKEIFKTCENLEDWGVKSFVLRRFANFKNQGLILNNEKPVIQGITPHSYKKFKELVKKVSDEFSFKVLAFPFYDPKKEFPFAILKMKNRSLLEKLPKIKSEATIITGKLAAPFLKKFFDIIDEYNKVNVVAVEKEIADLITYEDLQSIKTNQVKRKVIIPRGSLVHDKQVLEILSKDNIKRKVVRGPYVLTHPYFEGVEFSQEELISHEFKSFKDLIDKINIE